MGKVRREKKYRTHLKASSAHHGNEKLSGGKEARDENEEVVPLPEEVMRSDALLKLATIKKGEPGAHIERDVGRSKKEKMKLRREQWLQKIELSKKQKKEEKAAEERRKTVVVGDMQPLATSLPTVTELSTTAQSRAKKQKGKPHRTLTSEVSHFQDVLKHPAFKKDPVSTILEHVHNSITTETDS